MRKFAVMIVVAAVLAACNAAPGARAEDRAPPRTMTVAGEGEASGVPDIAMLSLGVQTEGMTAAEALKKNAARMNAVVAKLKARGVADKDMQSRNLSVGPRYDYSNNGKPPKIVGYTAQNMLSVKLRNLDDAGSIIDDVVADGANSLGGISFTFDNPESLMNEARKAAIKDARARAQLYADAAGVALGPILQINEGVAAQPSPQTYVAARAMKSEATPVQTGESTVTAHVTLVYEIK